MAEIFVGSADTVVTVHWVSEMRPQSLKLLNPNSPVPFTPLSDLNKNWKPSPHYQQKEALIRQTERSGGTSAGRIGSLSWNISVLSVLWRYMWRVKPLIKAILFTVSIFMLRCFSQNETESFYFALEPLRGPRGDTYAKNNCGLWLSCQTKEKSDSNNDI